MKSKPERKPDEPKRPRGRPRKVKPEEPIVRKHGVTQPGEMTIAALATGVGVSTTTIERYIRRGCPRTSIEAVQKWRSENVSSIGEDAEPNELMQELKRAEIAATNETARAKRLKNDMLEKKLVPRDVIQRDISIALTRTVNRLQSIPTEVSVLCPDELKVPVKSKAEQLIRVILKELKDSLEDML